MASKIQISRLEKWVARVFEQSTNKYSIVMVLGNNAHLELIEYDLLKKLQKKILS
jgi:hypothetical protein